MSKNPFLDLFLPADRYGNYNQGDERAWLVAECSECGGTQMVVVAFTKDEVTRWLRCMNCKRPHVQVDQSIVPARRPLTIPKGVVGVELAAWKEVRDCLSAGAYTAAVMMCRKLLFHLAVAHGLPEKDARGRAPSFLKCVERLEGEGLITTPMRPWVDRIKDVGNEANHEIQPVNREVAMDVATFVEQLLRLTYEMDQLISEPIQVDES